MNIIGRIGNILYCYIGGARIIVECTMNSFTLSDVIDYTDVPSYSSLYFIDLAIYGESQYNETEPITDDDKILFAKLYLM